MKTLHFRPWAQLVRAFPGVTVLAAMTCFAPVAFAAQPTQGPQASLTLNACDAKYCYTINNTWTLVKTATADLNAGSGSVIWDIQATKTRDAAATFTVRGGLTITNSGSAPATVGNIVINLQRPYNQRIAGRNVPYVSLAANIADGTSGDAAVSANIVAAASQEVAGAPAGNYAVAGAKGTFTETPGKSGTLEFKDATNNSLFAIDPDFVLPVGESVTLLYDATFDPSVVAGLAAGTQLRVEALVSFGNVNSRGNSGASATNIDVDGSGAIETDEANVRTVPCRVTMAGLPSAPAECNATATITDPGLSKTGTATFTNVSGLDQFPATISDSALFIVSADVDGGGDGGTVCNEASLAGTACEGGTLALIVGYTADEFVDVTPDDLIDNPINVGHQPIYATYDCTAAASATDSACVDIGGSICSVCVDDGNYCSFSQGGFGGNGAPFNLLAANFAALYPTGVEVGIPGAGGFSMKFTSATAVQAYLPAGGQANKLTADTVDPTSTASGQFGGQVLALKLNVALSDLGLVKLGDLYYCDPTSSLHGQTVRQILAAAEIALGGGAVPSGYNYSSLAGLCANLDLSFDGKVDGDPDLGTCGVASAWAIQFLNHVPCQ